MVAHACGCGLLAIVLALGSGCANTCVLARPYSAEKVKAGSLPAPRFEWSIAAPLYFPNRTEYTVTVASDQEFKRVILKKEGLTSFAYQAAPDDGWLPGGAEYSWKVEGTIRTPEGELVSELACANPRRFFLEKRDRVSVDLKLPKEKKKEEAAAAAAKVEGSPAEEQAKAEKAEPKPSVENVKVAIGDEEFTSDASFDMEHGETRPISISFTLKEQSAAGNQAAPERKERAIRVGGVIQVVGANQNTKFGKIIIDNFTSEELTSISKGEVGNYTYQLGGTDIVKIVLGNKA